MPLGPFDPIPPREKIRRSHINDLRTALTGIQDAYDVAVANGFVGTRGQWLDSLKGEKGDPGAGLAPIGSAATFAALPATGNTEGDVRTVDDTGRAYRWDGSEWIDVGLFRGPPGDLSKSVADTLYPAKDATEAALAREATRGPWDSREWGIDADGNDHAGDFATMISQLATEDNRAVQLQSGDIGLDSTVTNTVRGLRLIGSRGERPGDAGGTRIVFAGTGAAIQNGTDSGQPHDDWDYDGLQDFTIEGISLKYGGGATTALANGLGSYGTGTYAIRDWRGGNVTLTDVLIENFEYGFWGIQSDINIWTRPGFRYCHVAVYLGPHSDQNTILHTYSLGNDTLFHFDAVRAARIIAMQSVADGSDSTPAVRIGSNAWNIGSIGVHFELPWFERTTLSTDALAAFVDIGVGDSVQSTDVTFRNPIIVLDDSATFVSTNRVTALARVDNADRIAVENPEGAVRQLRALVQNVGANNPRVRITGGDGPSQKLAVENTSTGTAVVQFEQWGRAENVAPSVALTATIGTTETTIPHGLPYTPAVLGITPKADARVWESTPADATNIYLTASASVTAAITLGSGTPLAAFNTIDQYDTFTDTDGTVLNTHTPDTGTIWGGAAWAATITGNVLTSTIDYLRVFTDTGVSDYRVALTVNTGSASTVAKSAGVVVRATDTNNYWYCNLEQDAAGKTYLALVSVVGGSFTLRRRQHVAFSDSTAYRLVVEVRGDELRASVDGLPVMTYTGMTVALGSATNAGFAITNRGNGATHPTIDDVEIRTP